MSRKFKVGDKVIIIGDCYTVTRRGWTGTILTVGKNTAGILFDNDNHKYDIMLDAIKLNNYSPKNKPRNYEEV